MFNLISVMVPLYFSSIVNGDESEEEGELLPNQIE